MGIQRKLTLQNLKVPFKLLYSLIKARKIIKEFKPNVVVGVGGYASGPLLKIATSMGVPALLQEQNSYPGVTNKILSKKVHKICVAYHGMEQFFPKEKIVFTVKKLVIMYSIKTMINLTIKIEFKEGLTIIKSEKKQG
jgi:UDP-N-acetylglucosamine--N-acetylmuramyl-(pentapeptide) pyrophosphoryl-undecaprenol N-acetylglucosamine transferase